MGENQNGAQRRSLFQSIATQQSYIDQANQKLHRQGSVINAQAARIKAQGSQIEVLARGLRALTEAFGPQAVQHVTAAMAGRKTADVQNPAQPIPEPPAQPAPFSTVDTKTPEAMESGQNPGLVPGSTNDVAADATTTVYQPGQDIDSAALHNLVDVTTPVDGTQGPQPIDTVRTLTDVRVGDPMNMSQAFPLRPPFDQQQRTSAKQPSGHRAIAAMRLVEARAASGDEDAANDKFAMVAAIEGDHSRTVDDIEREIKMISQITERTASRQPSAESRGLVPRSAGGGQPVSMHSTASYSGAAVGSQDIDDSDLFL